MLGVREKEKKREMERGRKEHRGADLYHLTRWGNGIVDKPVISHSQTHRTAAMWHITAPLTPT